jgi:hypothetical protein
MPSEEKDELELSQAMIDAGVTALFKWSGEFEFERLSADELSQLISEIVAAVLKAREGI